MPRGKSNRGGVRQGAPGQAYGNRTDLNQNRQPVQAAAGQPYGVRAAQEAAQRAVPLPAAPPVPVSPPPPAPGTLGQFLRPTENPREPLTAGMDLGAGPGPEALAIAPNPQDDVEAQLLALYRQHPNNDLLRLIRVSRERDLTPQRFGTV